jgi:hypothetical protein
MSDWTAALTRALDSRETTVEMFFRDDDAGWADDRLFALLDVFASYACPIDLAAIPAAVSDKLAALLVDRKLPSRAAISPRDDACFRNCSASTSIRSSRHRGIAAPT